MLTFPKLRDDWSLDAVNAIAFLGEHNIIATSQQMCISKFCFLPRLIPAPQGLLAQRAKYLPSEDGFHVQDIKMGAKRVGLGYFARIVHNKSLDAPPLSVRVLRLKVRDDQSTFLRPRLLSPLNIISMIGFAASIGLTLSAVVLKDAAALAGVLLLSCSTPILCLGLYWTPFLPKRLPRDYKPDETTTIVIKARYHSFTIVECPVQIAYHIYHQPSNVPYLLSKWHVRTLSGVAPGILLVCSIVLFGSATRTMKTALIVTYTVLNLLYWIATVLPASWSWHINLDFETPTQLPRPVHLTQAIWSAIWETKSSNWAKEYIPPTRAWDEWLREAQKQVQKCRSPTEWDPQAFLEDTLYSHLDIRGGLVYS